MREVILVALLIATVAGAAAAQGRDPDYDKVLKACKAKRWAEFDRLAPTFLAEKPDYKFAHSVRFMIAESYRQRNRMKEAAAAYEDYLRRHPKATLADRSRGVLIRVLNEDRRHADALERAKGYLAKYPEGKARAGVVYERAAALEGLRRFEEAVQAFDRIEGRYREQAQYRIGIALFRGREFTRSKKALESFLERFPGSSWERTVREYLYRVDAPYTKITDGVVTEYEGKYVGDPEFEAIRRSLPKLRKEALDRIRQRVGIKVPRTFLIRFEDAGSNRSGLFACTQLEVVAGKPRQVLVLYTEYLKMGVFDLPSTLTHELYHCVQRERLGEDHYLTPKWVREGSALYVAGQGSSRTRFLAAELGRRTNIKDPMARLVNGLGGRPTFDDYAENVAAFEAAAVRHGRVKLNRFLGLLLATPDVENAVKKTLGEDMETFERKTAEHARKVIAPLLAHGREEMHAAARLIGKGEPDEALRALPKDPGVYAAAVVYMRALAHLNAGRPEKTLTVIRQEYYPTHRLFASLTDNAMLLEVKALKAMGSPEFASVAERARRDLEPTSAYRALLKVID